jgi:outer membrane protein assembly factor BamA
VSGQDFNRKTLDEQVAELRRALDERGYRAVRIEIALDYRQEDQPVPVFTIHHEEKPRLPA